MPNPPGAKLIRKFARSKSGITKSRNMPYEQAWRIYKRLPGRTWKPKQRSETERLKTKQVQHAFRYNNPNPFKET